MAANVGKGSIYKLGRPYTADIPLFSARKFSLRFPGIPTGVNDGLSGNQVTWNAEFLATEVGQVGIQFDGLGHIGVIMGAAGEEPNTRWHNSFTIVQMANSYGLNKLGVKNLNPVVARGVLIDVAAIWGSEMKAGDLITMEPVDKALAAQGMSDFKFASDDAVTIRTGWEKHSCDAQTYNAGCPGIGVEVARWIAEDIQASVTGFDTCPEMQSSIQTQPARSVYTRTCKHATESSTSRTWC